MKVFAFDRDQTVTKSQGPIPIDLIDKLKREHLVIAIGNQRLKREAAVPGESSGSKRDRLKYIKWGTPWATKHIVIDDDDPNAPEGWDWYQPEQFMSKIDCLGGITGL